MYPYLMDGDKVLVLKQNVMEEPGQIGVVLYNSDYATIKKVQYCEGEDWMTPEPMNPAYPPITISGEELEQCRILGIPKFLVREVPENNPLPDGALELLANAEL